MVTKDGSRRGRRPQAHRPRCRQVVVRFSEDEHRLIQAAADRKRLAVGAWVGDVAFRSANDGGSVIPVSWRDVLAVLIRLRADLADAPPAGTEPIVIERLLRGIDELVDSAAKRTARGSR